MEPPGVVTKACRCSDHLLGFQPMALLDMVLVEHREQVKEAVPSRYQVSLHVGLGNQARTLRVLGVEVSDDRCT